MYTEKILELILFWPITQAANVQSKLSHLFCPVVSVFSVIQLLF